MPGVLKLKYVCAHWQYRRAFVSAHFEDMKSTQTSSDQLDRLVSWSLNAIGAVAFLLAIADFSFLSYEIFYDRWSFFYDPSAPARLDIHVGTGDVLIVAAMAAALVFVFSMFVMVINFGMRWLNIPIVLTSVCVITLPLLGLVRIPERYADTRFDKLLPQNQVSERRQESLELMRLDNTLSDTVLDPADTTIQPGRNRMY
jgi:hypothetical protein